MALPAHSKGGKLSIAAVDGFKEEFISLRLYLCPIGVEAFGQGCVVHIPCNGWRLTRDGMQEGESSSQCKP